MFHKEHPSELEKQLRWQKMSKKKKSIYFSSLKKLYGETKNGEQCHLRTKETETHLCAKGTEKIYAK